ncbi:hypothetical protein ACQQ2N_06125 [Dokdonella sp. MW10]|uniref:hypothetical protein n=1 Tax=Dokdonella sp. MW10 TaxID=2992926 RepID=UPI003F818109
MKPVRVLVLTLALTAGLATFAASRWLDPEPGVYDAFLATLDTSELAIASAPTLCGAGSSDDHGLPPELVAAFREANRPGAGFADVSRLRGRAAVANSRQLAALDAKGLPHHEAGSRRLPVMRLSRVGFAARDALFCASGRYGAGLVHLREAEGIWRVISVFVVDPNESRDDSPERSS